MTNNRKCLCASAGMRTVSGAVSVWGPATYNHRDPHNLKKHFELEELRYLCGVRILSEGSLDEVHSAEFMNNCVVF